jgi:hypothetical protein
VSWPRSTACITASATHSLETLCWGKTSSPAAWAVQRAVTSVTAIPTGSR